MPLINQVHIDTLLSNLSLKYRNQEYIAMEIFPEVAVKKSSDLYRVYARNFRIPETKRAHKAEAREHTFEVSTASYSLERHSLKDYVSDTEADNYDLADLRAEVTEELTDVILRRLEKSVATLFTSTSWSQNLSLSAAQQWNGTVGSASPDPIAHFDTGTVVVVNNSGKRPNFVASGLAQWNAFKNNFQILDRIKYTSQEVSQNIAAALIGVKSWHLAAMSEDTSPLNTADSVTAMFDDHCLLGYKPDSPGPLKVSAGYIFRRSIPMTKRWRVEEREADAIEVNMEYQVKIVGSLAGFLIKDVSV